MDQIKAYVIQTTKEEYSFYGKYLPEREKPNWHYYECEDGTIMHFRKDHMVCVEEIEIKGQGNGMDS